MDTFYRATLHLHRVDANTDRYGTTTIAEMTVTGGTPADAMVQLCTHANALHDWHEDQADDEQLPALDEAVKLGPPLLDLSKMFQGVAATTKVRHRCAICGTLGPIAHEGNTWICAGCNTLLDAQKAEADKAHLYPNVITREDEPADEPDALDKASQAALGTENRCSFCGKAIWLIDAGWKHQNAVDDQNHIADPANVITRELADQPVCHCSTAWRDTDCPIHGEPDQPDARYVDDEAERAHYAALGAQQARGERP